MISISFDSSPTAGAARYGVSRRKVVLGVVAAMTVPLGGCGGGLALFAPFISFTFVGVVDGKIVSISFSPSFENVPSGNFDATSQITVLDPKVLNSTIRSTFSGSFDGRDMQLTVVGATAPLGDTYSGRFIEDDTIVLTPLTPSNPKLKPITVRLDNRKTPEKRFVPTLTGDWTGKDANGADWALRLDTDPLNNDAEDATVLLVGTETLGPAAGTTLLGYASVHYIELDIGALHLTGTLQAGPTPPKAGNPQVTATINFKGGGSLQRKV